MVLTETVRESIASARTRLDDLQAEMEAAARCADRIHADATAMDLRVVTYCQQTERLADLVECAANLRESIREQRAILRDLRAAIDQVRRRLLEKRDARATQRPGPDPEDED